MVSPSPPPHDAHWSDFKLSDQDLDFVFNLLLEREKPLTTREMIEPLVRTHLERLEREASVASKSKHPVYRPAEPYEVGQKLAFPALDGAVGQVVAIRPGENPDLETFSVIEVEFENGAARREFAASLPGHKLNQIVEEQPLAEGIDSVELVLAKYGQPIEADLIERLEAHEDIVRIAYRWFPRSLLANIHAGHLNLAEAVLDVAEGGPLPTEDLVEHIDLPASLDPLLAHFSVDYALQEDERFDEVGPAGEILWFLQRLEPPEVLFPPPRLVYERRPVDRARFTPELEELEIQLDDEFSPGEVTDGGVSQVVLPLLFPHWRVGALPLSPRLRQLFPTAYEAPRIRFVLVDGHSQDRFPGWVLRKEGYVFGLDEWYRKHGIPAGGLVRIRQGDKTGEVIVEALDKRRRNDWIRTVAISEAGQVGFTMLKQPVGASYDEQMVVGLVDPQALDEAWLSGSQRRMSDDRLALYVFRELAKLNPQSAVHAKSLYSGVNVLRRLPPGPIFQELVTRDDYEHVGDLYWRLRDHVRGEA